MTKRPQSPGHGRTAWTERSLSPARTLWLQSTSASPWRLLFAARFCCIGTRGARSSERVSNGQKLKFQEIAVIRVERWHAVLEQDSCDMGVRDEIAANGRRACYMPIGVKKSVQLGHSPHVRQSDQPGDVS